MLILFLIEQIFKDCIKKIKVILKILTKSARNQARNQVRNQVNKYKSLCILEDLYSHSTIFIVPKKYVN
jgi:hypothetical protein